MINDIRTIYFIECMAILLIINFFYFIKEIYNYKKHKNDKKRKRIYDSIILSESFKARFLSFNILICLTIGYFTFPSNESLTTDDDISKKISEISSSLNKTSTELNNIQQQLEARIEYVENLKKEAEIAENVISLSEEQVNAVQSKINQELNASNGKNTMITFLISALFFALGLVVQPIINFFKQKNGKYIDKNIEINQYNKEELLDLLNEAKNMLENNNDTLPKND